MHDHFGGTLRLAQRQLDPGRWAGDGVRLRQPSRFFMDQPSSCTAFDGRPRTFLNWQLCVAGRYGELNFACKLTHLCIWLCDVALMVLHKQPALVACGCMAIDVESGAV